MFFHASVLKKEEAPWADLGRSLRLFLGIALPGAQPIKLKEVILVTSYDLAFLDPSDRSSNKREALLSQKESDTPLFPLSMRAERALDRYEGNINESAYWSIQYVMSDGVVLNPLAALTHQYGLCLPKALVDTTKSDSSTSSTWLAHFPDDYTTAEYYQATAESLRKLSVPIRLTSKFDWSKERTCIDVNALKKLDLNNYDWHLNGKTLSVRPNIDGHWTPINMGWAFNRDTGSLAYHPSQQAARLVASYFRDSFTPLEPRHTKPNDLWSHISHYDPFWNAPKEMPVEADGSLKFSLASPYFSFAKSVADLDRSLAQYNASLRLPDSALVADGELQTEAALYSSDRERLSYSFFVTKNSDKDALAELPESASRLFSMLESGLERFAGPLADAPISRGPCRSTDMKLWRHRGLARCVLLEFCLFQEALKTDTEVDLKSAARAIGKKATELLRFRPRIPPEAGFVDGIYPEGA